tara:strand:- start:4043 stop:4876 length:834 start_codon:yes stop_codon:yes gene_type:complete
VKKIQTSCKGCCFIEKQGDSQVGCSLGRHSLLGVESLQDDGSFMLDRFCNTYRPEEWAKSLSVKKSLDPEATVLDEVFPRIGFFVNFDTDPEDTGEYGDDVIVCEEMLAKTLESIANIDGTPSYVIVINDRVEHNQFIWEQFFRLFGDKVKDTKYHIVQIETKPEKVEQLVDESFKHAENGWIYTINSGDTVDPKILQKIQNYVNIKMEKLTLVKPDGDVFSSMLFPAFLFKFLNGNRNKIFQDTTSTEGSFLEKMEEADKRSPSKTVVTWEEFNAS